MIITPTNQCTTLFLRITPRNTDLQAKNILRNRPWNPILMPSHNLPLPQGRVTCETFGTGQEGDPGLTPKDEPLIFIIPTQIIQEGDNTQESQQGQRSPPLCCLTIWETPKEDMEYQSKTLRRVDQESPRYQTRDITLIDDMVSAQPWLIPQVTGVITQTRFW